MLTYYLVCYSTLYNGQVINNNIGHVNKSNKEINKLLTSKLERLTKLINKHIPYIVCEYYSKYQVI